MRALPSLLCGLMTTIAAMPLQAQRSSNPGVVLTSPMMRPLELPRSAELLPSSGVDASRWVVAHPLSGEALRLDGRLDEPAWRATYWVSDFTQREPLEGGTPTLRTEVGFLYDADALYIGARMLVDSAGGVRALVTRRDVESTSDQIVVSLDTYRDRRSAFSFGVTAAGVRVDYLHPSDRQGSRDYSFDPVWQAKTAIGKDAWTAELRIPFSQLRFNRCSRSDQQSADSLMGSCAWGLNLTRRIPARNEEDYLVLVRRTESGWASRFADLAGLEELKPSSGLALVPYIATEATLAGDVNPADPFSERQHVTSRAGADLRWRLASGLTLDATVNPDFAQVEADPAEVNLTAFETVFPEHRPFFVEGGRLLEAGGLSWFHSRRIGQPPRLKASGDYAEKVTGTTILGAAKLSGRLAGGLSIGLLGAVTGPEAARSYVRETDTFARATVEPRTSFGVLRLRQDVGRSGSGVGIILTGVERDLAELPGVRAYLVRRAVAGAVDWYLRSPGGAYALSGALGFSHVQGDSAAILRIQKSSAHYFQRPDGSERLDPSRQSLSGTYGRLTLEKMSGRWLWSLGGYGESPGLEINDAGRLKSADNWGLDGTVYYRQTTPAGWLRTWELGVESSQEWNYDGVRQVDYSSVFHNSTWKNYWSTGLSVGLSQPTLRDDLTRGGPLMGRPREWNLGVHLAGNPARRTTWKVWGSGQADDAGGWYVSAGVRLVVRPGARWELSTDPSYSRGVDSRQYFTVLPGGSIATYGNRYVFAYLDREEISTRLRASFALTPDLTLESYAEPFGSRGEFFRLGELPAAGSHRLRTYGTDGTVLTRFAADSIVVTDGAERFRLSPGDYSVLSFRSSLVLRWEWRPGSTAYIVWQQKRGREGRSDRRLGTAALWDALGSRGDNILALKVSLWLSRW